MLGSVCHLSSPILTVPLANKSGSDNAMPEIPVCDTFIFPGDCCMYIPSSFKIKDSNEWHSLVKRMDAEVHLDVGGATTPDEFDRIALTIAFACPILCECFLDFHVHMMCLFLKRPD